MTTAPATGQQRTPPKRKARQVAKHLRDERPDYAYLKAVFRALRDELDVQVEREPKTLPYMPNEDEIRRYYQSVWQARRPYITDTGANALDKVRQRQVL